VSHLELRGRRFDAGRPAVTAIVNRSPDSFYPGNRHADVGAVRAGEEGGLVPALAPRGEPDAC